MRGLLGCVLCACMFCVADVCLHANQSLWGPDDTDAHVCSYICIAYGSRTMSIKHHISFGVKNDFTRRLRRYDERHLCRIVCRMN